MKSQVIQIHIQIIFLKLVSEINKNAEAVYLINKQNINNTFPSGSISFIEFKENILHFIHHKYITDNINNIQEIVENTIWSSNNNTSILIMLINTSW